MPRLNINFDLDGVLVNYLDHLKTFLAKRGIQHIPTGNWFFDTVPEISNEKLFEYINEAMRDVAQIFPMPGAHAVLRYLHDLTGDPITIVTNRPISNIDVTVRTIDYVTGGVPYLFAMVDSAKEKPRLIRTKCFIDDRRRTAIGLAKKGYTVFMPKMEYNTPIIPQEGFSIVNKGKVHQAGVWKRTDGQIHIIKDIRCLLKSDNLALIIS